MSESSAVHHSPEQHDDSARLLRTLIDNVPAMIGYWDKDLHNVHGNDAYVEWFGMSPQEMVGLHIREVIGEDLYAKNLPHIKAALAGQSQMFDREIVDASGVTRYSQAYYIPDIVEEGEVKGFFVLVVDVSDRVGAEMKLAEAHAEMAQRATSDSLTGLANRSHFEERLNAAIAASARSGRMVGLVMIDLDEFKPVNDLHGHAVGDALLGVVAKRLTSVVRETDLVARIGGDEFVVLCPEVAGQTEVATLADRLVEALDAEVLVPFVGEPIKIGGSLGVVVTQASPDGPQMTVAELLREADMQMYSAKKAGGRRWHGATSKSEHAEG